MITDGHASAKLLIKTSGIRQVHCFSLVTISLHAKNYQNIQSGLKVTAIFTNITDGHGDYRTLPFG